MIELGLWTKFEFGIGFQEMNLNLDETLIVEFWV